MLSESLTRKKVPMTDATGEDGSRSSESQVPGRREESEEWSHRRKLLENWQDYDEASPSWSDKVIQLRAGLIPLSYCFCSRQQLEAASSRLEHSGSEGRYT